MLQIARNENPSIIEEKRNMERDKNFSSKMPSLDLSLGCRPPLSMAEGSSKHNAPRVPGMPSNDPPNLRRDLIFLILQFLDEEKFSETIHKLEKESGVYFNMKHFEDTILVGDWEEAENYVSGFLKINDSTHSSMLFFHLRWHKYFESIIRGDRVKALDILKTELKVFQPNNPQLFEEMAKYLTMPSYMERSPLSFESCVKSLRTTAISEINSVIVSHPLLHDKLNFPMFSNKRLRTLLNKRMERAEYA